MDPLRHSTTAAVARGSCTCAVHLEALVRRNHTPTTPMSAAATLESAVGPPWTAHQVVRFTQWILRCCSSSSSQHHNNNNDRCCNADGTNKLVLAPNLCAALARLVPHWDNDGLLYTAAVVTATTPPTNASAQPQQHDTVQDVGSSLLSVLYNTAIQNCQTTSNDGFSANIHTNNNTSASESVLSTCHALEVVALFWNALPRLQSHCELKYASSFSTPSSNTNSSSSPAASTTVARQQGGWWMPDDDDKDFTMNPSQSCSAKTSTMGRLVRCAFAGLRVKQEEWNRIVANDEARDGVLQSSKNASSSECLCQFKTACCTILTHGVRCGFVHPDLSAAGGAEDEEDASWARKLLQESSRLNDRNMPRSAFTLFSLQCLELLVALEQCGILASFAAVAADFYEMMRSTGMVSFVIAATLGGGNASSTSSSWDDRLPRWTRGTNPTSYSESCSSSSLLEKQHEHQLLLLVRSLYSAGTATMMDAIAQNPCSSDFLVFIWSRLLEAVPASHYHQAQRVSNHELSCLSFLHETCRSLSRQAFSDAVIGLNKDMDGGAKLLLETAMTKLLDWEKRFSSIEAASLVQLLLRDRLDPLTHDAFSRCIWSEEIIHDSSPVPSGIVMLFSRSVDLLRDMATSRVDLSSTSIQQQPHVIVLLDTLYILLHGERSLVRKALCVSTVETMIQIMSTKQHTGEKKMSGIANMDQSTVFNLDDSTPPMNNLSRLEDCSVVDKEEVEHTSRGWETVIPMAAAATLGLMANCTDEKSNEEFLFGRINVALHSCLSDVQTNWSNKAEHFLSFEFSRRRLRLLTSVAASGNEEGVSNILYIAETAQMRSIANLQRDLKHSQKRIYEYLSREQTLMSENRALELKLHTQASVFQLKTDVWKVGMERRAKDLVSVYAKERYTAESQVAEMKQQLTDAQSTTTVCRSEKIQAESDLRSVADQLQISSLREKDAIEKLERRDAEFQQLSAELQSTKLLFEKSVDREKELNDHVADQRVHIEQVDLSEIDLRESLESLFGDMVRLAQLYVVKEEEEVTHKQISNTRIEKLKRRLEEERQRNAEMEERDKINQYENEVLSQKYAKARERLEKERDDRMKEADQRRKRAGPVSYINQLHNSSTSERSNPRKGSKFDDTGSKENSRKHSNQNTSSR